MEKSLTRIIGITFLFKIIIFLIVLVNNVLVSRWLGPAMFGAMATLLIFAEAVEKSTSLGLETSLLYFLSNRRFPEKKLISTSLINGLVLFAVGSALIFLFIELNAFDYLLGESDSQIVSGEAGWCIFLLFASLVHQYGGNIWLGKQQFNRYNANLLFRPIIYFILLMIVYFSGLLTLTAVLAISGAAWLLVGLYIWIKSVFPLKLAWDKEITKAALDYGSKIMMAGLLNFLIYRMDIFLIGFFLTQQEVGWYFIAVMIAERLLYLTHSAGIVLLPAAARSEGQRKKTPAIIRLNLLIIVIGALALAVVCPFVIPAVLSQQYQNSVLPLIVYLPGVIAITLPKVLGADLAARGLPQFNFIVSAVNFAVNLVLNLLLIPRIGIIGAALSSTISYAVAAVLISYFYKRLTGTPVRELLIPRRGDWQALKRI